MTLRHAQALVILVGLAACNSIRSDTGSASTRLTGGDFVRAVTDERVGIVTGMLQCEVSRQESDLVVFRVGLRPLAQAVVDYVNQQPHRAQERLRDMMFSMEIDSSWINREPAAADPSEVAPFDGDYWRVTVLMHREEAVGFVRGYRDCLLGDTARIIVAPFFDAGAITDSISHWYGLDRATGDVDSARAGIAVRELIERAVIQSRK